MGKIFSPDAPDTIDRQLRGGLQAFAMILMAFVMVVVAWGIVRRDDPQANSPIADPPKSHMTLEIVNTAEARRIGLSKYQSLDYDRGMGFEFETVERQCMWNKNVPFAVSVAFIGVDGKILNIEDMRAHSTHLVCSAGPTKYAIETRTDWMNDHWRKPKGK